jgi:hypothetical protein
VARFPGPCQVLSVRSRMAAHPARAPGAACERRGDTRSVLAAKGADTS